MQLILAVSIGIHGPKGGEKEVVIDSTVQEKNVTYPTDTKLYRKVIVRCWKLADKEQIRLRRRYGKEVSEMFAGPAGPGPLAHGEGSAAGHAQVEDHRREAGAGTRTQARG